MLRIFTFLYITVAGLCSECADASCAVKGQDLLQRQKSLKMETAEAELMSMMSFKRIEAWVKNFYLCFFQSWTDVPAKFAYVWYLADSDADIACAILVAASTVSKTGLRANTDLVVVYNKEVPGKERFEKLGVKLIQVEEAAAKGEWQWKESFLKLRAAQLFGYDRVIYFDADSYPLGSLDNLFDIARFPVEIAAPRAYWLKQPFVQSGGPMVIDPKKIFFDRDFLEPMKASVVEVGSEMDWVNSHLQDRIDVLDGFYALLIGEWCPSDGIYQHWQKFFGKSPEWVMENAVLVHFIAGWKPWSLTSSSALDAKCPNSQAQLLQIYEKWWRTKAEVCQ